MKEMNDYHNFYSTFDVLLLVDVFKKFSNNTLENYGLCPSHYLSAPALSWDAMLHMTKMNSNLFQILTCVCSLKKLTAVGFLIGLIDIVKPTISI